jgi:radical SAM protein with 4Fe4S-binding SPASM domain
MAIRQLGCQAGRGYLGISAEGDVAPCVHLLDSEVTCGNVRRTPLSEILKSSEILERLRRRDALKGKCGRCKYRDTCGGCRALAYYHHGDYLAEDPTCFFEPENAKAASEHEPVQNENVGTFARFVSSTSPWKEILNS